MCVCVDVFPISPGHLYPTLSQNPPLTHLKQITCQQFDLNLTKTKENYSIMLKWTWCTLPDRHTWQGICNLQNWKAWSPNCSLYASFILNQMSEKKKLLMVRQWENFAVLWSSCHMWEVWGRFKKGFKLGGCTNRREDTWHTKQLEVASTITSVVVGWFF